MTVHVVGAGLAGLSCALALADAGTAVVVHEAGAAAGGRCRSFHDARLGRMLDNGSHVLLGANAATFALLRRVGAEAQMAAVEPPGLPFLDLRDGSAWTLGAGRRIGVAGVRRREWLASLRLALAGRRDVAARRLPAGALAERLWRPLCEAALNTPLDEASAALLRHVLAATLLRGEAASRAYVAAQGLSAALVDPVMAALAAHGVAVRLRHPLRAIRGGSRAEALLFADGETALGGGDAVVLALPPWTAKDFAPWLPTLPASPIVNAHYRLDQPVRLPGGRPLLGLVGGRAQWLFARDDVLSVTVSAADALAAMPSRAVAGLLWREIAPLVGGRTSPTPPCRVVKERRATLRHSPAALAARPPNATRLSNLFLAGDWTETGLPCTIEGAILSGTSAANGILTISS